ncbi:MAG: potassium channel family protein [Lentisphaerota bacterium]
MILNKIMLDAMISGRYKCTLLTIMFIIFFAANPVLDEEHFMHGPLIVIYYLFLILAPYFIASRVRVLAITLPFGIAGILGKLLFDYSPMAANTFAFDCFFGVLLICFDLVLITCVIVYTCSMRKISLEAVSGSIMTYFMIAFCFADIFFIINRMSPGAFSGVGDAEIMARFRDMLYFSFTTLTTLGYGDIVPRSELAKRLVCIEVVTGVLFVAVFIGRIIALFTSYQMQRGLRRPVNRRISTYKVRHRSIRGIKGPGFAVRSRKKKSMFKV